ncbi:hypothetical protein [Burkholderia cepacia]|uniref:hypothetical protein n=1 Tax=Burkholderia cepacia TaxID=292 RepID=UPI003EE0F1CA
MDSGRRFVGCNESALNAAVFPDSPKQALAVSIDRRRTGGDIPAGTSLNFPIPDSTRK